ncbi:fibronectin type III domain-containing protein, partial [Paenibacillus provencensis]
MEKNLKRSLSILLSASLLSTILPFREAVAASNAPSFTGVYQKDDHVKLEWAVDMNPSDILSNTSYESGQEQPNLLWGWTGAKTGNQSIVKGSNGTNVVKLTDTYTNRAGNWFNYPNTDADSSIHLYKGKSVPAGSTLSLSFKAKMTGGTTGMLYSFITTGWFKKGYERRDDNGRIIRFAEDVDFNNPPEEFSAYVDGGTLTMQDTSLVVVSSHGTNYDYGVIYYDWNNSKKKFVKGTSGTGVWNNPSPTGQPMTMRKDVFRVGEPLLVYREQPSHFPTRWMNETQNNQWVTYSSNVYISENTDYDFVNRGVLPYIVWATDGTLELDDFKLGYATEVEVFRDSESIYRGYLADYEDYAATDKAKPNVPSNVKVTMGSDRKARVTWDAATDRGTTYNYTIKGYPKNASETLVSIKKPVTVTAEIKGYSLVIDQNPSTIPTANITTTSTGYTMPTVVNGNFYVHIAAVDNKNNISSVVHIPYVDTTNPTINISPSNESWTSESIELTAVASDGETGVKRIKLPDGTWANHATASYSVTQNGTYTFVAEDNAGNQTEYTYTVSNIDKTAPTIQITPQSRSWSEEDIQIKIQYADAQSGINPNKRQYKVTTSPEMPTDWDIAAEDEQFLTIHNEGTWYIHAKTTDRVGYETTITTERLQLQEQPAAPDLQAYGIGENSATLEWAVPAASTYTDGYRYTVQNLSTGQSWEVEHPANSFVDSSLSGGNTYQYQVVVTNHVGQSVSNPIEITTLPEKPSSVQVSKDGRAADRALVNISPVDSASSYRIVATETATQQEAFNQTVTDTVYQPINNLRPGSTYDIAVSAINATGEGEATHVGFLTLPDTPAGFSGLEITEHTISLLWNSVNTATYYALERDEQLIYGGTEPSYLDTGLESGTSYDYRVAAENETGYGEYATIDDVITLPARVEGIRSLASTTSDISFEWDAVRGADGYLLTINGGEEIQLPAETQQFTASGLESGSTYEIQVTASNRSGSGQSNSIVLSTLPDAPAEVLVQEIGEQEATVWIPEVQGATKYLLSVNGRTYETSSGEMVITGLSGGQNYPFTVAAGNMAGYGAATSGEFLTLPYMPNNVQAESTDHSIEMSWDAVPSATSYVVYDS